MSSDQNRQTLLWCKTTELPLICALCDDFLGQETMRFDFRPRCLSLAFFLCPWRTASVVPIIAGQAAIAVKSPNTITFGLSGAGTSKWEDANLWSPTNCGRSSSIEFSPSHDLAHRPISVIRRLIHDPRMRRYPYPHFQACRGCRNVSISTTVINQHYSL